MNPSSRYGPLDRLLHRLALGSPVVREMSFALERRFMLRAVEGGGSLAKAGAASIRGADSPVYICGLARSGTTILLYLLHQLRAFRSLTYRDMPFPLAPNLWRRVSRLSGHRSSSVERAHGDDLSIGFDMPEAFEEVFWRTIAPGESTKCVEGGVSSAEVITLFADYRALVTVGSGESHGTGVARPRYLSKNNNNLTRLPILCSESSATVLVPYRNPVDTARSLNRQHLNFRAIQSRDRFSAAYMRWLGHHEFGLDHRPYCFAADAVDRSLAVGSLDYWLDYWRAVYGFVLGDGHAQVRLVDVDRLRQSPEQGVRALLDAVGVGADASALARQIAPPVTHDKPAPIRSSLLRGAADVYEALRASRRNMI